MTEERRIYLIEENTGPYDQLKTRWSVPSKIADQYDLLKKNMPLFAVTGEALRLAFEKSGGFLCGKPAMWYKSGYYHDVQVDHDEQGQRVETRFYKAKGYGGQLERRVIFSEYEKKLSINPEYWSTPTRGYTYYVHYDQTFTDATKTARKNTVNGISVFAGQTMEQGGYVIGNDHNFYARPGLRFTYDGQSLGFDSKADENCFKANPKDKESTAQFKEQVNEAIKTPRAIAPELTRAITYLNPIMETIDLAVARLQTLKSVPA